MSKSFGWVDITDGDRCEIWFWGNVAGFFCNGEYRSLWDADHPIHESLRKNLEASNSLIEVDA